MIYKTSDGTELKDQFQLDGIKYPENWLELSTVDDRTRLGIVALPEPPPPVVEVVPEVELTPEELIMQEIALVKFALQNSIDEKACALGFSGGNALMLYAGFTNAFQPLAITFATWEATVWVEADTYKAQVVAGTAPMLTPEEAVALMPAYPT